MPDTDQHLPSPDEPASGPVLDVLRGVAIASVLLAHYPWRFLGGGQALAGYGDAAMVLFFVAEGYGASLSLRGRRQSGFSQGGFYFAQFLRLYPLYWAALAVLACLPGPAPDAFAWLGLQSPYWYVHALVQCVALAPLFHWLRQRHGAEGFLSGLLLAAAAVNVAAWQLPEPARAVAFSNLFAYRGVVLGHVALFAASMLLPDLAARVRKPEGPGRAGWRAGIARAQALAAWLVALVLLGAASGGFSDVLGGVGLSLASLVFAAALLSGRAGIPLAGTFALLGRNAYAMYLFEPFLYVLLFTAHVPLWTPQGAALYAGALPAFVFVCRTLGVGAGALARLSGLSRIR